ncbi:MAG TPA: 4-hydroxy-tetrahydrodipicolinate reductase [Patescibacteria group bacterium]|nr:4-hydroxy-tetrahydrodipicolinate reductase [Patescibacteria group bacterium]
MQKVILAGALGRMGRMVAEEIAAADDMELAAAVEATGHPGIGTVLLGVKVSDSVADALDAGDLLVDFTTPEAALAGIRAGEDAGKAVIVGTTGLSGEQLAAAREAAKSIPLLISPNMSPGVNLLFKVVEDVARVLHDFDAEVIEIHHNRKKDSPSGTAAKIGDILARARSGARLVHGREGIIGPRAPDEIGMHSLRGGDVTGEHTVIFAGEGERFELTHRAHSRRTFARGTVRAIRFMKNRDPGLYSMADVLGFG